MTTRIQASSSSVNPVIRHLHQELSKQPTTATLTKIHDQVKAIKQDTITIDLSKRTNFENYQLAVDDCSCLEIRLQIALRKQGIVIPDQPVADVPVSAPTQAETASPVKVQAPAKKPMREMSRKEMEELREQEWRQTYTTLLNSFARGNAVLNKYAGVNIHRLPDETLKEMHREYMGGRISAHLTYDILQKRGGLTSAMAMEYSGFSEAMSKRIQPINELLQMRMLARQQQPREESKR